MAARYRVYARDVDRRRLGEMPDYGELRIQLRFNDVGSFVLTCPVGSRTAELLAETGGIIVTRDLLDGNGPHVVFSGFVTRVDPDATRVEVTGVSDEWVLQCRAATPDPTSEGTPGDPFATEQDIRSGTASTVMIAYIRNHAGDLALASNQIPGLTTDTDLGLGSTVYGQARFISLLALMQELALAGGGLRFQVLWNAESLVFSVSEPADRSDTAVISTGRGNLGDWRRAFERATATRVYVLGQGQGINRQVVQAVNATTKTRYGFSIDAVVDRRDSNDTLLLAQEAANVLAEGDETRLVAFTPIDTANFKWGVDYDLGDLVRVVTGDGETLEEVVRGVDLTLTTPDGSGQAAAEVQPIVSTPGDTVDDDPSSRQQRAVTRRVSNLERNIDSLAAVLAVQWNLGDIRCTTRSTAAAGWLLCQGQAVSRTTYAALFGVIGTTYGTGDGSTTFNLPDLRDRVVVGAGSSYSLASTGGAASINLAHDHSGAPHTHSHDHTGAAHSHSHSHTGAAHTHSHAHTGAPHTHSHSHSGASHVHTHTHTGAPHTHSHSHTGASLTFTGSGGTTGTPSAETNNLKTISPEEADASTKDHTHSFTPAGSIGGSTGSDSTAASFSGDTGSNAATPDAVGTTGSDASAASFSGNTGTDATAATFSTQTGTDASGASAGNTGSDATAASYSGNTGSALTSVSVVQPYMALTFEIYAGV